MKSIMGTSLMGAMVLALIFGGCGKKSPTNAGHEVGSLQIVILKPSQVNQEDITIGKIEVEVKGPTSFTVELEEGTELNREVKVGDYTVTVRAYDEGDELLASGTDNVTVEEGKTSPVEIKLNIYPPSPVTLSVIPAGVTDSTVGLVWTRNRNTDFLEYQIYRSTSPNITLETGTPLFPTIQDRADTVRYAVGLTPNTMYYFTVITRDTSEIYSMSNEESARTLPIGAPRPVFLHIVPWGVTDSTVRLVWTQNNDADFFEYRIYSSMLPNITPETGTLLHPTFQNRADTVANVIGLSPNTRYYFKVYTCDTEDNCSGSNEVFATTSGGGGPGIEDTLFYDEGDVDDSLYIFSIPDEYGDDLFNVRFTALDACTLKEAMFYFYHKSGWTTPDARIYIWNDAGGFPGALIDSVNVSGSSIIFGDWHPIDLWPKQIVVSALADFHIGYTVVNESGGDTLGIFSDDGEPEGEEHRSSENWDGDWGTMFEDWGVDVNFLIRAVVVCQSGEAVLGPSSTPSRMGMSPRRIRRLRK